jgi:uncharacterized protein
MPQGKPAGIPCTHLTPDYRCDIFASPERPTCCSGLMPSEEMCGTCPAEAMHYLETLERMTRP